MDKLEYIPGDLVKFATNNYTIVNFEENFLHNKICYALISTNSTKTAFVADRDILPIPLTPEILEKNGWEKLYEKFFEKNVNDIRLTIELSENLYVAINRIFIMEIHYVHELQHLLFGLGLNSEMEV
jgi:hypothetical protein